MTDGKGEKYSEERMNKDHWQTALTGKEAFNEGTQNIGGMIEVGGEIIEQLITSASSFTNKSHVD